MMMIANKCKMSGNPIFCLPCSMNLRQIGRVVAVGADRVLRGPLDLLRQALPVLAEGALLYTLVLREQLQTLVSDAHQRHEAHLLANDSADTM